MKSRGSLQSSQQLATCFYPDRNYSIPQSSTLFTRPLFEYYFSLYSEIFRVISTLHVYQLKCCTQLFMHTSLLIYVMNPLQSGFHYSLLFYRSVATLLCKTSLHITEGKVLQISWKISLRARSGSRAWNIGAAPLNDRNESPDARKSHQISLPHTLHRPAAYVRANSDIRQAWFNRSNCPDFSPDKFKCEVTAELYSSYPRILPQAAFCACLAATVHEILNMQGNAKACEATSGNIA